MKMAPTYCILKIFGVRVRGVVSKKKKKKIGLQGACLLALGSLEKNTCPEGCGDGITPRGPSNGTVIFGFFG